MNRMPSKSWTPMLVATTILAGLMVVALAPVSAAGASQEASEAELQARLRAELEARLAQISQRAQEQTQEVEARHADVLRRVEQLVQELELSAYEPTQEAEERRADALRRVEQLVQEQVLPDVTRLHEQMQEIVARQAGALRRVERQAQGQVLRRATRLRLRGGCEAIGERILAWAEELELTDAQADSVRDAQRAARREGIGRDADMEMGEMDLEALYEADDPDLGAIRAKLEELAMLGVDDQMAGLALRNQVFDILTPEQREQYEQRGDSDNLRVFISGVGSRWNVGRIGC